jgi:FixJ family two-component response regulator
MDRLLRSVGHEVRVYGSADEYLTNQRTDELSCLVVDIRLPGTSGLELQDYLHRVEAWIPVILISGHGDIPMTVRAMKAGPSTS